MPRIALCDTYTDQVDETLRAAEALGDDLDSVRIDTTGSRRGDFRHILREVRWELDVRGREDDGLFASGGLDPAALRDLRDVADGFGVGSYVSNANPRRFLARHRRDRRRTNRETREALRKEAGLWTSTGGHHVALADHDAEGDPLLKPLIRDGEIVREFDLDAAAERAAADAELVGFGMDE